MKKTVSIAIGGIVFHIEEDAYQTLSTYLEGVQRYFSTFPEGREIVQDIEARIAELLQKGLKDGDREAVNEEDVSGIIATMGTVADFEAAEADEPIGAESGPKGNASQSGSSSKGFTFTGSDPTQTTWRRSATDKIVAGVFGGIGARIGTDPLWLRVAFVAFFLGLSFLPAFPVTLGIAYLVLAVIMPLGVIEAPTNMRKLYREPKGEVIGGVAGGLAAFLHIDVTLIRIAFVALIFAGGAGIIVYVILWALTTPASKMTDRMRMRGEPINLSSINDRVSALGQNLQSEKVRSGIEKVLYLPFTILGALAKAFIAVFKGLVRVFGAFIGLIFLVVAFALLLLSFVGISQLLAGAPLLDSPYIHLGESDAVFRAYLEAAPDLLIWAVSALVFFIGVDFTLAGLSLIAAKSIASKGVNLTVALLTVLSLLAAMTFSTQMNNAFREKENIETTSYFSKPFFGVFSVAVPEVAAQSRFPDDRVTLHVRQGSGDSLSLVQSAEGCGKTRAQALSAAGAVQYAYRLEDDTLLAFEPNFKLANGAKYQLQEVHLTLSVPEGVPFRLSDDACFMAKDDLRDIANDGDYSRYADHLLTFRRGKLVCLDCPADTYKDEDDKDDEEKDGTVHVERMDISSDGDTTITNIDSTHIEGDVVDLSINKKGITTIVEDKKTGQKVRIQVNGDSILNKVERKVKSHRRHRNN